MPLCCVKAGSLSSLSRSLEVNLSTCTFLSILIFNYCMYTFHISFLNSEEGKDGHSLTPDQASSSSGDCTNTQSCSAWTTSTEVGFRRDLAALDADIARLQIQFNVAQDLYH